MLIVNEFNGSRTIRLATIKTVDEVCAIVNNIFVMEEDSDNPGCYDILTRDLRVISVEPMGKIISV